MSYPAAPPPQYPAPQYPAPIAPPRNGLGIAGFVLGLIGFLVSVIPIVGLFLGWEPAIAGLILSIVGLSRVKKGVANNKGMAIAGLILSILALLAGIAYFIVGVLLVSEAADELEKEGNKTVAVVYDVTGDSTTADVTYTTFTGGSVATAQENPATLPWHKEMTATGVLKGGSLTVSTGESGGSVTCTLTIDGKMVSTDTATGPFSSASCLDL